MSYYYILAFALVADDGFDADYTEILEDIDSDDDGTLYSPGSDEGPGDPIVEEIDPIAAADASGAADASALVDMAAVSTAIKFVIKQIITAYMLPRLLPWPCLGVYVLLHMLLAAYALFKILSILVRFLATKRYK